jgi:RNA polymerase sigma factor (sigma-70 family)
MSDYVQLSDSDLIARCLAEDALAWETLVRRYQRLVSAIAFRFGLKNDDAADVFQSVCLVILQQLPTLREQAKLSSWLITITVRECWKFRERRPNTASLDDLAGEHLPELSDESHLQLEASLLMIERQHLIRRAVETLAPQCQKLIAALFYTEAPAPYTEISRRLGIPVASIGPTRGRCLARLKEVLKQSGFDES